MPIPDSDSSSNEPGRAIDRPVLWYDGDCDFCCFWVERWKRLSGNRIQFRSARDFPDGTSALSSEQLAQAVHLVEPGGQILGGAAAIFRLRELGQGRRRLAETYRSSPGFASFCEGSYRLVARHRSFFSCLTRTIRGRK